MKCAMEFSGQKETIDNLKQGDMLITNFINEQTVNAHNRGVYVIGVTNSYFRCSKFSENDHNDHKPNYNDLQLEDISNEMFDSQVPGQIGLVNIPYIPEMKVGAGTGNFMIALYWLVNSEVAHKMVQCNKAPSLEYATQYYNTIIKRLDTIYKNQHDTIWSSARETAIRIGNGSHMWVESEPKSAWCDASGASMGLVFTNHFPKELMKKDDVMFIGETSSNRIQRWFRKHEQQSKRVFLLSPSDHRLKKNSRISPMYTSII